MDWKFEHQLDATGLMCPEPVMLLHKVVREASSGDCIKVIATDPATRRDIPQFCQFLNHELLESQEVEGQFFYLLRKV